MTKSAQTSAMRRINELLDDNSFVEVGAYMTARSTDFNMQAQETPADGVVTGYGTVEGALVYVYSQDAAVMGGSVGEMHAKKIENLYGMAMKMGAPVVGLIDCAGLRLQEGLDALNGFGRLYGCQTLASRVIRRSRQCSEAAAAVWQWLLQWLTSPSWKIRQSYLSTLPMPSLRTIQIHPAQSSRARKPATCA